MSNSQMIGIRIACVVLNWE